MLSRRTGTGVNIGSPDGRIALWLNEQDALDLAELYGPSDGFYAEVMRAVEYAYPPAVPLSVRPTGEAG